MKVHTLKNIILFTASLFLAQCGGGGGSDTTISPAPISNPFSESAVLNKSFSDELFSEFKSEGMNEEKAQSQAKNCEEEIYGKLRKHIGLEPASTPLFENKKIIGGKTCTLMGVDVRSLATEAREHHKSTVGIKFDYTGLEISENFSDYLESLIVPIEACPADSDLSQSSQFQISKQCGEKTISVKGCYECPKDTGMAPLACKTNNAKAQRIDADLVITLEGDLLTMNAVSGTVVVNEQFMNIPRLGSLIPYERNVLVITEDGNPETLAKRNIIDDDGKLQVKTESASILSYIWHPPNKVVFRSIYLDSKIQEEGVFIGLSAGNIHVECKNDLYDNEF